MTTQWVENVIFILTKLTLLLRRSPQYCQEETKMWDITGDKCDSHDDDDVYINTYTKKITMSPLYPYLDFLRIGMSRVHICTS